MRYSLETSFYQPITSIILSENTLDFTVFNTLDIPYELCIFTDSLGFCFEYYSQRSLHLQGAEMLKQICRGS